MSRVPLGVAILQPVVECQRNEWKTMYITFRRFFPKLDTIATSLERPQDECQTDHLNRDSK